MTLGPNIGMEVASLLVHFDQHHIYEVNRNLNRQQTYREYVETLNELLSEINTQVHQQDNRTEHKIVKVVVSEHLVKKLRSMLEEEEDPWILELPGEGFSWIIEDSSKLLTRIEDIRDICTRLSNKYATEMKIGTMEIERQFQQTNSIMASFKSMIELWNTLITTIQHRTSGTNR